jgi:hypothetical protein
MIICFLGAVHSFILAVPVKRRRALLASNPIRGIAGAELIADDEKSVVLPTRSFAWARGPDRREEIGPRPRIWFWFDHIGPIDSALP